jgi:hypothetical protein
MTSAREVVHLRAVHYAHVTACFEPRKHLVHELIEVLGGHAGIELRQQLQQVVSVHSAAAG